jgi:hypothetical protein
LIVVKIAEEISDVVRFFKELAHNQVYVLSKEFESAVSNMPEKAKAAGMEIGALGDVAFMGKKSKIVNVLRILGVSTAEQDA